MSSTSNRHTLSELQSEALKEILNMGAGRAAASLEALTGEHYILNVPEVDLYTIEELRSAPVRDETNRAVMLHVGGDLNGFTSIVFSLNSARRLISTALGDTLGAEEREVLGDSTLMELGNVVIGSIIGVFANTLRLHVQYSSPTLLTSRIEHLIATGAVGQHPQVIVARITFKDSQDSTEGYLMTVFDVASMGVVIPAIDRYLQDLGVL